MAKRLSNKAKLSRLEFYKAGPLPEGAVDELDVFLKDANHLVVAYAAEVAGKYELKELIPQLVEAFERLIKKSYKADVACLAKNAIIDSLDRLKYRDEEDVFYRGISFVQQEPAFGGSNDTAAELRGKCALALARLLHHEIFFLLANLLADPEPQARGAAVSALSYMGTHESELLLRMRILSGEPQQDLLASYLSALMQINAHRSMPFVARFLTSPDPLIAEEAALALGESKTLKAFEILNEARKGTLHSEGKKMFILPIALTRQDEAFSCLLDIIEDGSRENAAAAVEAVRVFGMDDAQVDKIRALVEEREDMEVSEAFRRYFE